jgi:hypothetical protein
VPLGVNTVSVVTDPPPLPVTVMPPVTVSAPDLTSTPAMGPWAAMLPVTVAIPARINTSPSPPLMLLVCTALPTLTELATWLDP